MIPLPEEDAPPRRLEARTPRRRILGVRRRTGEPDMLELDCGHHAAVWGYHGSVMPWYEAGEWPCQACLLLYGPTRPRLA